MKRLGLVPYAKGLALQRDLVDKRRAGDVPDQLLLLEHPHVITMGSSAQARHLLLPADELSERGIELHSAGRGGDVTYHGPGQLVGYPILDLKPDRCDLHRYLRDLEEVLIRVVGRLGLGEAERREGLTGVWLPQGKVAAVGVRVSSGWITSHGFALNCATELEYFRTIVPCGIEDEQVTSLSRVMGRDIGVDHVAPLVVECFGEVFERVPG